MKETTKGYFCNDHIFGTTMDYPEDVVVYTSKKVYKHLNNITIQDVREALESYGDMALDTKDGFFGIYSTYDEEYIICSIEQNTAKEGYFVSLVYCMRGFPINAIKDEACPVIII